MLRKDPLQTAVAIWALTLLSGIVVLLVYYHIHNLAALKDIILDISISNCIGPVVYTIPFWLLMATVLNFWFDWKTNRQTFKMAVILVVAALIALLTGYYTMVGSETTQDMWVFVAIAPVFTFIVLNK